MKTYTPDFFFILSFLSDLTSSLSWIIFIFLKRCLKWEKQEDKTSWHDEVSEIKETHVNCLLMARLCFSSFFFSSFLECLAWSQLLLKTKSPFLKSFFLIALLFFLICDKLKIFEIFNFSPYGIFRHARVYFISTRLHFRTSWKVFSVFI